MRSTWSIVPESDATAMSTEMTASDDGGDDDTDAVTRTTIKVDDEVWRRVRLSPLYEPRTVL